MNPNLDSVNILLSLAVALILYLLGIGYALSGKIASKSFAVKIFSIAFTMRLIAVFTIYFSLISLGGDGYVIKDDRVYNLTGLQIANDLTNHKEGYKSYGSGYVNIAYFNINGFLYHYLNFDTLTMRTLNAFFGSIVVVLIFNIMMQLFDFKIAKIAAIMIAIVPNMIFWSASQVKDPLIILSTISIIYIMICKFQSGIKVFYLIPYLFFMFLLWHLRKDFCFPLIAISLLWLAFRYTFLRGYFDNPRRAIIIKMAVLTLFAAPLLIGLAATNSGMNFLGTMAYFNEAQKGLAGADSGAGVGFSRYLRVVSLGDFYKLPPAMAFTAVAPLPALAKPKNPLQYGATLYSYVNIPLVLLMPFVVLGFLKFKSSAMKFTDELLIKWLPMITLVSISIIYLGNLRYKASIVPYFLMWAAVGWHYRKKSRGQVLMLYGFTVVGVVTMVTLAVVLR